MRVLFCNVAWMRYYNGVTSKDEPRNGGSWVNENQTGAEIYNFTEYDDENSMDMLQQNLIGEKKISFILKD